METDKEHKNYIINDFEKEDQVPKLPKSTNGEETKMETKQENKEKVKMKAGAWDSLKVYEKLPRLKWEKINESHTVIFLTEPKEIPDKEDPEAVFYAFDVTEDGVKKQITTSAWSLTSALKQHAPLIGKVFKITKTMTAGRQGYKIEFIEDQHIQEEDVKLGEV